MQGLDTPCSRPIGPGEPAGQQEGGLQEDSGHVSPGKRAAAGRASLPALGTAAARVSAQAVGTGPLGVWGGGALVGKSRQKPSTWAGACVGLAGAQPPSISHRGPRAPGARARPWAFPEQLQIGKSEPTGTARPSRNGSALEGRKAKVKRRACTGLGMGAPAGLPRPSQGTSAALGPGGQGQPPHPARPPPQSCSSAPCLLGPARYSASFLPAGRLRQTLCLRVPSRYTGGFSGVVTELKMQA